MMRNLVLIFGLLLSVNFAMLGCETSKKGLSGGVPDSGASPGGAGSGGSATGGDRATGGTVGTGGAVGQGGSSAAAGSGGATATGGGSGGSAGKEGTGGATASGGVAGGSGTGGLTATGGVASTGGLMATGGVASTGGLEAGGGTGSGTGGARTGGSTGSGSGGASTGGSTGTGGSGTGGRGAGGAAAGGSSGGTGGAHAGGASGVGGTAGSGSGHASCQADTDCTGINSGYKCCNHLCSNTQNDILNCGGCGTPCSGPNPFCGGGTCGTPPCQGTTCASGSTCCSNQCCAAGKLCCAVNMGPSVIGCFDPVDGTCPAGCATCVCASPDTPIATPQGERPIAELRVGDWVYSVDHGQLRPVPIKRINRQSVSPSHTMVSLRLASGRTLLVSPLHPTADGRTFRDLARGDLLDGVAIVEARAVAYHQPFTYDILPDSDSGAYFAASVLIGSTLAPPTAQPLVSTVLSTPASRSSVR